jgi:hypothetical protein
LPPGTLGPAPPCRAGHRDLAERDTWFRTPVSALPAPAARLSANIQTTGMDGGHDLHYRTLQAIGVELVGRLAGVDGHQVRFADDLTESVAWGDARYADIDQLLAAQLRGRAPHLARPATVPRRPASRAQPAWVRRSDLHVWFSPRLRRLGPVAGVRLHGLPDHRRRSQHGGPRAVLLPRPLPAHPAGRRSCSGWGEDATVVAHAVARRSS